MFLSENNYFAIFFYCITAKQSEQVHFNYRIFLCPAQFTVCRTAFVDVWTVTSFVMKNTSLGQKMKKVVRIRV